MTDLADPPDVASGQTPAPTGPEGPTAGAALALASIAGLFVLAVVSWGPWSLFFIGALLVSIFLHEMGHFLAAKQAGMKVTEYFLGFGPRLWSFRRGETVYGIKPIPAGAYVKIVGMSNLEAVDEGDEGRTYREKGYWKRLRVVLAGPATNLALAFALLFVLNTAVGTASPDRWSVAAALPGTSAAEAGVQQGDRVVSLAGKPVSDFQAFGSLIQANAGKTVDLVVDRGGRRVTLRPTIGWALDPTAAARVGPLRPGDTPMKVGSVAVGDYAAFTSALASSTGRSVEIQFDRGGVLLKTTIPAPSNLPLEGSEGFLGVRSIADTIHQGPLQALGSAGSQFKDMTFASVGSLTSFFSPSGLANYTRLVFSTPPQGASMTPDRGTSAVEPVTPGASAPGMGASSSTDSGNRVLSMYGVLRLGAQAGAAGFASALGLLALVNLFLGIINLLPLLPFDGGHAAIATYEAIRGRIARRPYRADITKLMPVAYLVLAVFGFVFLSSTYLDAVRPVANPFTP